MAQPMTSLTNSIQTIPFLQSGTIDPTVTALAGQPGYLFFRTSTIIGIYQKQDSGSTTNWKLLASTAGAQPLTAPSRNLTAAGTLTSTDQVVNANATGGSFAITLPDATLNSGKYYFIRKTTLTNTVTLTPVLAQTIDGAATLVLNSQAGTILYSDGSNWRNLTAPPAPIVAIGVVGALVLTTQSFVTTDTSAGGFSVTLPDATANSGREITVMNNGTANNLTVNTTGGQTINGAATDTIAFGKNVHQYASDGANWFIISVS